MQEITNRINLNRWTTYLILISPVLLIIILHQIPSYNDLPHGWKFSIESILEVFTITLLYGLQFYLGVNFFKAIDRKAVFFKANGIFALLFCIAGCGWVLFHLPDYLKMMPTKQREITPTPIFDRFVWIMIFHLALTYFFVNNQVVKYEMNKLTDTKRQQLRAQFLHPMKKIVRSSALLIIGLFIYTVIYFMFNPKMK
jgi:hypothetical protein